MPYLDETPFKLESWVQVRPNTDDWTKPHVGKLGKVVMVGLDLNNRWIFDLEIDGEKVTSFRTHHLANTLQTVLMST